MDRQQLLETFVQSVGNRGPAMSDDSCAYRVGDGQGHPGCAIGCQPAFKSVYQPDFEGRPIADLIQDFATVRAALRISEYDAALRADQTMFLTQLQRLHDYTNNWQYFHRRHRPARLKQQAVDTFCTLWMLMPVYVPGALVAGWQQRGR